MAGDIIHVRGLSLTARHGVYEEERREGRSFTVDLDAYVNTLRAGTTDELQQTVDYRDLSAAVLRVMQGESRHLIETLAEAIAADLLATVPALSGVRVTVWKRATGVPGDPERVGVTIERARP